MKRLFILAGLILIGMSAAACDSSPQIATVTARAQATNAINMTLTAVQGGSGTPTQPFQPAQTVGPNGGSPLPLVTNIAGGTVIPNQPSTRSATTVVTAIGTDAVVQPPVLTPAGAASQTAAAPAGTPIPTFTQTAPPRPTDPATRAATLNASTPTITPTANGMMGKADSAKFIRSAPDQGAPQPTITPTLNSILATVAAARTLAAQAPTATPIPVVTGPKIWFDHATIYSLYVRSFRDSNGDGAGDLQGVIDGLDYIQSLGVDTLWLLPIFKSPSVHGYDTTDYDTVNPDYGTNEDLFRLIKEVHKRGMYILLDYVVNHTSDQHPYFKDAFGNPASAYSDYYLWSNAEHTQYSTFAGVQSMPKLNYDSPKVVQFATAIALHWADPNGDGNPSDGVDGYRCDVANGPYKAFWESLRAALDKLNPKTVLLGELFVQTPQDMQGYLGGGRLDAAFDFPLFIRMTGSWEKDNDGVFSGAGNLPLALSLARNPEAFYPPEARLVRFIGNHDTNRIMSDVGGDLRRAKVAALWLMTNPGPVMLYYGDEIGMKGDKCNAPDYDACRREPLDWYAGLSGPGQTSWFRHNNAPNDGVSIEEEEGSANEYNQDQISLLTFYRKLGKLRAELKTRGRNWELAELSGAAAGLYALKQWDADKVTLVFINFSNTKFTGTLDPALTTINGQSVSAFIRSDLSAAFGLLAGPIWTLEPGGFLVFAPPPEH